MLSKSADLHREGRTVRAWAFAAVALAAASAFAAPAMAQGGPGRAGDTGKQVYQKANCVGCHKWHGGGGGGYGGAALSLRASGLTREQIVEIVNCGRPGTGMPYHRRGAYDAAECYGLSREDLGKDIPVEGAAFLRPAEVEAVADYMINAIQGRGEPGYADCAAFFGEGNRACNPYRTAGATPETPQAAPQGGQPQSGPSR